MEFEHASGMSVWRTPGGRRRDIRRHGSGRLALVAKVRASVGEIGACPGTAGHRGVGRRTHGRRPGGTWTARGEEMASKAENTPMKGMEFSDRVTNTGDPWPNDLR